MKKIFFFILLVFLFKAVLSANIGNSYSQNKIEIISQTGIDENITWSFKEINNTYWIASFIIPSTLAIKSYPLVSLSSNLAISKSSIDMTKDNSFYIIFPNGFKPNLSAKFGYNSTLINTSTSNFPYYQSDRAMCRDANNKIHVVYNYNNTYITYANSTNGLTFTYNNSFYSCLNPSIACNGTNIVVSCVYNLANLIIGLSTDNGNTWSFQIPRTTANIYSTVDIRGNRIYVVYSKQAGSGSYLYQNGVFFNSSDLGSTWSNDVILWEGFSSKFSGFDDYWLPSISVVGIGTSSDKIFASMYENEFDLVVVTSLNHFKNSTDAGKTWSNDVILTPNNYGVSPPSIVSNGTHVFVTYSMSIDSVNTYIYLNTSANGGVAWSGIQISSAVGDKPTVALNKTYQWDIWRTGTSFNSIFYRSFNGNSWNDIKTFATGNLDYPNAKAYYYQGNCIEFIYRNGSSSPYNMHYANLSVCDAYIPTTTVTTTTTTTTTSTTTTTTTTSTSTTTTTSTSTTTTSTTTTTTSTTTTSTTTTSTTSTTTTISVATTITQFPFIIKEPLTPSDYISEYVFNPILDFLNPDRLHFSTVYEDCMQTLKIYKEYSITINATLEDTYVFENDVNHNFGSNQELSISSNPTWREWVLIKFNNSQIPRNSNLIYVKLGLYVYGQENPSMRGVAVWVLQNQTWMQNYPTWNNKADLGFNTASNIAYNSTNFLNDWKYWDVTKGIDLNYQNSSFMLNDTTGNMNREDYYAKECYNLGCDNNQLPKLEVKYSIGTENFLAEAMECDLIEHYECIKEFNYENQKLVLWIC
jgi:hypothetical protein